MADRVEKREAAETGQGLRVYGTKEAAEALGVTTSNIDKVVGLPAPVTEVAATRLWRADEIDAFALERQTRRAGNGSQVI